VFIFMTGSASASFLEKDIGNCQFCGGTDTVDLIQQTAENKFFGIIPMKPQIHRLAKCRDCKKSIKAVHYQGQHIKPMHATKEADIISTAN
jgi:hypothetical protein